MLSNDQAQARNSIGELGSVSFVHFLLLVNRTIFAIVAGLRTHGVNNRIFIRRRRRFSIRRQQRLPHHGTTTIIHFRLPSSLIRLPRFTRHHQRPRLLPNSLRDIFKLQQLIKYSHSTIFLPQRRISTSIYPTLRRRRLRQKITIPCHYPYDYVEVYPRVLRPTVRYVRLFRSFIRFKLQRGVHLHPLFTLNLHGLVNFTRALAPFHFERNVNLFPTMSFLRRQESVFKRTSTLQGTYPNTPRRPLAMRHLATPIGFLYTHMRRDASHYLRQLQTEPV